MTHALLAAAAASFFRVVPLACEGDRLAVAGGGVLRLAARASCAPFAAGRAVTIALDGDGRVTIAANAPDAQPVSKIPRAAYAIAPAAAGVQDEAASVTAVIEVVVPPRTPPDDDIYVSTERTSWSPAEVRMDRVDPRRFRLEVRLHRGARLAFRVTRGSFGTIERDAARALPPAHVLTGEPGAHVTVVVAGWADID